ncbi:MAG: transcription antitermination factor NusB [Propioniciclava sp.]
MSGNRENTTRTKARRRAVEILYEAEARDQDPRAVLQVRVDAGHPPVRPFTSELVTGVADHLSTLDIALRQALSAGWSLERMPRVDRAVARVAAFELAHTDTDLAVIAHEAADLAAELSTEQSPGFLTALIDRLHRALAAPDQPPAAPTENSSESSASAEAEDNP